MATCTLLGFNVFHALAPILVQLFYFLESAIERHHYRIADCRIFHPSSCFFPGITEGGVFTACFVCVGLHFCDGREERVEVVLYGKGLLESVEVLVSVRVEGVVEGLCVGEFLVGERVVLFAHFFCVFVGCSDEVPVIGDAVEVVSEDGFVLLSHWCFSFYWLGH